MVIVSLVILMINNSNSEEIPKTKSSKLSKKNPKKEDIQQTMSGSEINGYQPYYKTNENNKVMLFILLFIAINTLVLFLRLMEERVYLLIFTDNQ